MVLLVQMALLAQMPILELALPFAQMTIFMATFMAILVQAALFVQTAPSVHMMVCLAILV